MAFVHQASFSSTQVISHELIHSVAFAGFAISPNGSLLGTTSLDGVQIHALPWSSDKDSDDGLTSRMSAMLRNSIEAHYNPADILHYLAQAPASAEDVYGGLSRALATLGSDVRFNEFAGAFLGLDKSVLNGVDVLPLINSSHN
jgi:hypothetical protein